jgi:flagellar protein FliO/FliZ
MNSSVFGLIFRLVLALAVVLGLLATIAWTARRKPGALKSLRRVGAVEVVARQQLSRTASVQVVRMGERAIVLGVTEQQVSFLTEGHISEVSDMVDLTQRTANGPSGDSEAGRTAPPRSFTEPRSSDDPMTTRMGLIEALRERTTRR